MPPLRPPDTPLRPPDTAQSRRPGECSLRGSRVLTWSHACATSGHASTKNAVSTCGSRRPRSVWRHGASRGAAHGAPHGALYAAHCSRCPAVGSAVRNAVQRRQARSATQHVGQCAMHRVPGPGVARLGRERLERARHEAQKRRWRHGWRRRRARQPRYPEGHTNVRVRVRVRVTNVARGWVAGGQPPSASRRGEADHSLGRG